MPKWRNWQTRYVQGVVRDFMRVQILSGTKTFHRKGFFIKYDEMLQIYGTLLICNFAAHRNKLDLSIYLLASAVNRSTPNQYAEI